MRGRIGAVVAVVLLAVLALWWWWWPAATPPVEPGQTPPAAAHAGAAMRSAKGVVLPTANITPAAAAKPCVRGRVVNAVSNAGVASAQLVLATNKGAVQGQTNAQGDFEFALEEPGSVALAELTAEGYFPFRPEWGHFPIELTLTEGKCVTELVLTLVPRVTYRGLVVGPDDQPVSGASVTIATGDEPPGAPLVTAADGAFTFTARDGALLVARHPGFAPASALVDFRVGVSGEVTLKLSARPADAGVERARLEGVVIDALDAGIPGAQVKALQAVLDRELRVEGATETNAEGRFSFEVDGPGPWQVFAHVPGVLSNPVMTHGEPVVIRVVAGTELRGTVTDGAGKPVQSFSVMVRRRVDALRTEGEDVRHFVDGDGRFSIKGLAPRTVQVVVAALGYAPSGPLNLELNAAAPTNVEVKLSAGSKVAGRVIDRRSKAPIGGARISLEGQEDSTLSASPSARSDLDGGFLLAGVSPGWRSIFFTAQQHHARLVSVEIREGETAGPLLIDLGPLEQGEDPRLELVGIGAVLEAKGDALVIKEVMTGGGAAEVGLGPGDGILSIEGQSAAALGFGGGIERIRGPEGTYVSLEVRRADGSITKYVVPRRRLEH